MGTFHDLAQGDRFTTAGRTLDESDLASFVERGGYTHPLFTDPAYAARTPFGRAPFPGPSLLVFMGGLVEQTGRFDRTTMGLVGYADVRFSAPAFPGDTVRVEAEVLTKEVKREGTRGLITFRWRCLNQRDEVLVEATPAMLFAT